MSVIRLTRLVIPPMKEQKWGRIIHMTSASVKQPIPGLLLSNTIRPAVIGFTKSLARELAEYQVTVNSVCPGYFATDRLKELINSKAQATQGQADEIEKKLISEIPLGRMGHPEEFGQLVAFLASEQAGYITGTAVQIDGGYVKGLM